MKERDSRTSERASYRGLLNIPPELRITIYKLFLDEHRIATIRGIHVQPSSTHLALLRTCRRIYREAHNILWSYISLRTEVEIERFIGAVSPVRVSRVVWADLKVDERTAVNWDTYELRPLTKLRFALRMMTALRRIRLYVGEAVDESHTDSLPTAPPWFLHRDPEYAMCGTLLKLQHIESYELFLCARTLVRLFKTVIPDTVHTLRISGACFLPESQTNLRALRHLSIHDVILGPLLDTLLTRTSALQMTELESFTYSQVYSAVNVLQDRHLEALVNGPCRNLRVLRLMGPMRVSLAVLATCLCRLSRLEYLALYFANADRLDANLLFHLPASLKIFKLRIRTNSRIPSSLENELRWLNLVESHLLQSRIAGDCLAEVHLDFRRTLIDVGNRREHWSALALAANIRLYLDLWHLTEFDD